MEYIPGAGTLIVLVSSIGTAFLIGRWLATTYTFSPYTTILLQLILVAPLYYSLYALIGYLYRVITGYTPSNTLPSVSVNPNIAMFTTTPQHIPTDTGSSSPPIMPSSGGTTATTSFGTSCIVSINTTIANPEPASPTQLDYAPLVNYYTIPVAGNGNGVNTGTPVMTIAYMPQGNLIQTIFYEPSMDDAIDIPTGSGNDVRITIGTPPIRKGFSLFIRTRPSSAGFTSVEVYINGVLLKTATIRSSFFGGVAGNITPIIGYNASPQTYPEVDAELQSLMIWSDASALRVADIQALANQPIGSDHQSLQQDTTMCTKQ